MLIPSWITLAYKPWLFYSKMSKKCLHLTYFGTTCSIWVIFITFSPSLPGLIMSLITSHYMDCSEKFKLTIWFISTCTSWALTAISQRPLLMCRTMMLAALSPIAPWAKTIQNILPLCPPCPLRQTVWPCITPPEPPWCRLMCGCLSAPQAWCVCMVTRVCAAGPAVKGSGHSHMHA